jgi:hypothetical protein
VALPANGACVATWADPYLISPWATKHLPIDVNKAERPLEDRFNGPPFSEKYIMQVIHKKEFSHDTTHSAQPWLLPLKSLR